MSTEVLWTHVRAYNETIWPVLLAMIVAGAIQLFLERDAEDRGTP